MPLESLNNHLWGGDSYMLIRIRELLSGTMAGVMAIMLLIAAVGCAGGMKTSGAGAMVQEEEAAPTADFAGSWEGALHMMDSTGKATVVLTKSGDTFEGQATIELEGMKDTSTVNRAKFEGNTCQFWMTFEAFGVDVLAKASIEEGVMKGVCETYTDGGQDDEGTFVLTKK